MRSRASLPEWQALQQRAGAARARHLRDMWDDGRAAAFSRQAGPLFMDFSKQRLSAGDLDALLALAAACGIEAAIGDLMGGAPVNNTEDRAALHTALRAGPGEAVHVGGADVVPAVQASLARMDSVVSRIHSRQWRGYSGKSIRDVVNIGVGGSGVAGSFGISTTESAGFGASGLSFSGALGVAAVASETAAGGGSADFALALSRGCPIICVLMMRMMPITAAAPKTPSVAAPM